MSTTLITGGTVVNATGTATADVLVDGETIAAVLAPGSQLLGHRPGRHRSTRSSTRPASTSSPAASTRTPTWRCRSAAPTPRTPSRPAPGPRPGAARPASSTSPSSATASGSRTGSPPGTRRPPASARSTTASTRSSAGVDEFSLKAMDALIDEGITSFKLFMAYPGRLLLRRRADPAGHAEVRRDRPADHDARRERPGHRRAGRAALPARARPRRTTTASPGPGSSRRRRPTGRS